MYFGARSHDLIDSIFVCGIIKERDSGLCVDVDDTVTNSHKHTLNPDACFINVLIIYFKLSGCRLVSLPQRGDDARILITTHLPPCGLWHMRKP